MAKKGISTLSLALCLATGIAEADGPVCQSVNATIILAPDADCMLLSRADTRNQFPDAQFLGSLPGIDKSTVCYKAAVTGAVGSLNFTGMSVSAVTYTAPNPLDDFPDLSASNQFVFSAASTLIAKAPGTDITLGRLFFRDRGYISLLDGSAKEQLILTGATGVFAGAKGSLEINGFEFSGAPMTGSICR